METGVNVPSDFLLISLLGENPIKERWRYVELQLWLMVHHQNLNSYFSVSVSIVSHRRL